MYPLLTTFLCAIPPQACFGGVPTTSDPNTSAQVSRYRWEAYRDTNWRCIYIYIYIHTRLSAKGRAYFCKSIAIEMGGASRYFSKLSWSGVDWILQAFWFATLSPHVLRFPPAVSRNRNWNRNCASSVKTAKKYRENLFQEEPSKPKN